MMWALVQIAVLALSVWNLEGHRPTARLLEDVAAGGARANIAAVLLLQRDASHQLAPAEVATWADLTIAAQAGAHPTSATDLSQLVLGWLHAKDALTAVQLERLCAAGVSAPELAVRAQVCAGEDVCFSVQCPKRLPDGFRLVHSIKPGGLTVDGQPVTECATVNRDRTRRFAGPPPGDHVLGCELSVNVYVRSASANRTEADTSNESRIWSREYSLRRAFEVLPDGAPDPVALVRSAAIDRDVQSRIAIHRLRWPMVVDRAYLIYVDVSISEGLPCPLACDVRVAYDGTCCGIGRVQLRPPAPRGKDVHERVHVAVLPEAETAGNVPAFAAALDPRKLEVVFSPSRMLARRSVDLVEIWGGSLRFGDLSSLEWSAGSWHLPEPVRNPAVIIEASPVEQAIHR